MPSFTQLIESIGSVADFPMTLSRHDKGKKLIYVNQPFCSLTQYSAEFVLNRNCRFLQGQDTAPKDIESIRSAFKANISIFQDIVNYKKNNEKFFNRLVLLSFDYGFEKFILGLQHEVEQPSYKKHHYGELDDKFLSPLSSLLIHAENLSEIDDQVKEKMNQSLQQISDHILKL